MRYPYIQVTQETWARARILGALLSIDRHQSMGIILDMWAWILDQGPEDQPPTGILVSPRAPAVLAGAVEWRGKPQDLVDALAEVQLIEITRDGLRVRGLDRYKRTWEKNRRRRTGAHGAGYRRQPGAGPAPQTQTQTQTQTQNKETTTPTPPPPRRASAEAAAVVVEMPKPVLAEPPADAPLRAPHDLAAREAVEAIDLEQAEWVLAQGPDGPELEAEPPPPRDFWEFAQLSRAAAGLIREIKPPRGWTHWVAAAEAQAGTQGLSIAYGRFLADRHFEPQGWPMAVFMRPGVWTARASRAPERLRL